MSKELKKMREIRKAQVQLRKQLKSAEEANKDVRSRIGQMWGKEEFKPQLEAFNKLLIGNRASVRAYQITLRELKHNLRAYNKQYDNIQSILKG